MGMGLLNKLGGYERVVCIKKTACRYFAMSLHTSVIAISSRSHVDISRARCIKQRDLTTQFAPDFLPILVT